MRAYLSDPELVLAVCTHGLLALLLISFVFALNRDGIPTRFRVRPSSAHEWRIYYLHTLEALTLAGLYCFSIGHSPYAGLAAAIALSSFGLLILSSLAIWHWDHHLCYRELIFCVVLFLLVVFAFPAISITREA